MAKENLEKWRGNLKKNCRIKYEKCRKIPQNEIEIFTKFEKIAREYAEKKLN